MNEVTYLMCRAEHFEREIKAALNTFDPGTVKRILRKALEEDELTSKIYEEDLWGDDE
jgi:hypothetical protein